MTDAAGPAVAEVVRASWPDAEIRSELLPDEEDRIAGLLKTLSENGAALVLTVGGTGLSPRDRTPEATRRVLDREAPGIAEAIRSMGSEATPFAWLSRGVSGLRGTTLIVNLPGSERGARQSVISIVPILKHALEVAAGGQSHPVSQAK